MENITIFDCEHAAATECDGENVRYLLWSSYSQQDFPNSVSIPRYIEEHADFLRQRYLDWIYCLGEAAPFGRRVIDMLQHKSGLSLWWMNPVLEKCNYDKSPWINDAIKLMALDEWIDSNKPGSVKLVTPSDSIAECIGMLCLKHKLPFQRLGCSDIPKTVKPLSKVIYRKLPAMARGLVWLVRHVASRWHLRGVGVEEWKASRATLLFVSYLLYLTPESAKGKKYESRYWADLPDNLNESGVPTNWLHIYVQDGLVPTDEAAADLLKRFNSEAKDGQRHVALHSFMTAAVIFRTLAGWIWFVRLARPVEEILSNTTSNGLVLWPLFRSEWRDSMIGAMAVSNHLYVNLFIEAMRLLPKQDTGVYLQENMDWEYAFLSAWKSAGHGRVIGHPHATVRYWDLRYYFDARIYGDTKLNSMPMPDAVALNGAAAIESYKNGGYPMDKVLKVEALRYLHLNCAPRERTWGLAKKQLELLVLCDYSRLHTNAQLRLLAGALQISGLRERVGVTVKPHISSSISPNDYPDLRFQLSMEPISQLLERCDMAFTSTATSAAVDAYCAGVPVAVCLDPKSLNLSALREREGVNFVATPRQLAIVLEKCAAGLEKNGEAGQFFFLDSELSAWKKLLADDSAVH